MVVNGSKTAELDLVNETPTNLSVVDSKRAYAFPDGSFSCLTVPEKKDYCRRRRELKGAMLYQVGVQRQIELIALSDGL